MRKKNMIKHGVDVADYLEAAVDQILITPTVLDWDDEEPARVERDGDFSDGAWGSEDDWEHPEEDCKYSVVYETAVATLTVNILKDGTYRWTGGYFPWAVAIESAHPDYEGEQGWDGSSPTLEAPELLEILKTHFIEDGNGPSFE